MIYLQVSLSTGLISRSSISSITFWAGTIYLDNGGTRHEVEEIIVHEGYVEEDSWKNDIAVVKVYSVTK